MSTGIESIGWNEHFEKAFTTIIESDPILPGRGNAVPARVITVVGTYYRVLCAQGEFQGSLSGRLMYTAATKAEFPAVGDWVIIGNPAETGGTAIIHAVLPRQSQFSRKSPERRTEEQVIAANIDTAVIVTALDRNFSLRRIERFLTLTYTSGSSPVIVLSKADLCADVEVKIAEAESVAPGVPVVAVSTVDGSGLETLRGLLSPGKTATLLGSSGVGKSSLLNALAGEHLLAVNEIREIDGKGRHTTTHRELVVLPSGALLIDNPGIRELQLWADEESLAGAFEDIVEAAVGCRFRDCSHTDEPGCAVLDAVEKGSLPLERLQSYRKLQRELRHLAMKQDGSAARVEKQRWKTINKWQKEYMKHRHAT